MSVTEVSDVVLTELADAIVEEAEADESFQQERVEVVHTQGPVSL